MPRTPASTARLTGAGKTRSSVKDAIPISAVDDVENDAATRIAENRIALAF